MKVLKKKAKGFTLVELVICIAIIAILVSIAIPQYNKARLSAIVATHNSNVQSIKSAAILTQMEDENTVISADTVKANLEGEKLPTINKEISADNTWTISADGKGNIEIKPGLKKLEDGKIVDAE